MTTPYLAWRWTTTRTSTGRRARVQAPAEPPAVSQTPPRACGASAAPHLMTGSTKTCRLSCVSCNMHDAVPKPITNTNLLPVLRFKRRGCDPTKRTQGCIRGDCSQTRRSVCRPSTRRPREPCLGTEVRRGAGRILRYSHECEWHGGVNAHTRRPPDLIADQHAPRAALQFTC
jgi:hypothetical protein